MYAFEQMISHSFRFRSTRRRRP